MGRQDMGSSQVIPPPPPGFKMVDDSAIPPPPPGFKLQGEAPSTTPQESAPVRFARGVGRGAMNLVTGIPTAAYQAGKEAAQFHQAHPVIGSIPGVSGGVGAYRALYQKPTEAAENEMQQAAQAHGTQVPMLGHALAHVPIAGPMALSMGKRAAEGDVAGALGEAATYAVAPEIARNVTVEGVTAPIRGIAKAGNSVLQNPTLKAAAPYAGMFGGYLAGEAIGHPWLGMGAGGTLGRAVQAGKFRVPGENFGLENSFAIAAMIAPIAKLFSRPKLMPAPP